MLVGECLDIGTAGLPYLPIAEALRSLARRSTPTPWNARSGRAGGTSRPIVPELAPDGRGAPPADPTPPDGLPSGLGQARLFERVLGLLRALGGSAPVCS